MNIDSGINIEKTVMIDQLLKELDRFVEELEQQVRQETQQVTQGVEDDEEVE
jgi:hypothetical protein